MNGVGDAQAHAAAAAAAMMQQVLGMSLPMAQFLPEQGSAKLTRPAGLPLTPTPTQAFAAQHRGDACMEAVDHAAQQQGPRKAHRRSRSDVPFGYFAPASSGGGGHGHHHLPPPKVEAVWGGHLHGGGGDDELFNAYLNLEGMDGLNSSDDRHDDGDSRGSSMKTNGADSSENESEECAADSRAGIRLWTDAAAADRRERLKRTAAGEPAGASAPMARHARSLSMDSLIGKLNFSTGAPGAANSVIPGPNRFSLEFGSGEFTPVEMKKIMADDKLTEMALADPKRVKRVLANRQSVARSTERKMRYIAELEQKVQILQTEATTLSAQLTLLQRDSAGIATQNNELKFRLQAMEQQAQLRDALNEALTTEVQRLKIATAELGDSCSSNNVTQQQIQISVQEQMFQLHQQQQQQQAMPIPFYQLQQNGAVKKHESKE